jgi:hypothetical protein
METTPGLSCHAVFFEKPIIIKAGSWLPLIIIFASAAITLEQEPNNQTQWESDSNQGTGSFSQEKTNFGNNIY